MDKFPLAVEIEINHACNRTCAYCPNSKHERIEKGEMEPALFRLLMEQLRDLNYKGRISYHFYNEPLLSKNLDSFVALTKEHLPECRIDIYTNGSLLTGERLSRLVELGVDKFSVTEHVNADLAALNDASASASGESLGKIRRTHYTKVPLSNRGGLVNAGRKDPKPPLDLPCYIPNCVLVITLNGHVLPCYEDFYQRNTMGNIRETHLKDIWSSEKFRNFREQLRKRRRADLPVCKDCNNTLVIT